MVALVMVPLLVSFLEVFQIRWNQFISRFPTGNTKTRKLADQPFPPSRPTH